MLKIGDKVPDFKGVDQNDNEVSYQDFAEKKLIVFFYPKASTPGCTAEACDLRDNENALKAQGYYLVGVSADSVKRQKNFADKNNLPFPLLADENHEILNAFGVKAATESITIISIAPERIKLSAISNACSPLSG